MLLDCAFDVTLRQDLGQPILLEVTFGLTHLVTGDPIATAIAQFNGRKVALFNPSNGHFLIEEAGSLWARKSDHGVRGHFLFMSLGANIVQLQAYNGSYVAIDLVGLVFAGRDPNSANAKFYLEWYNGLYAFRNLSHNRHLGISKHGHLEGHHSLGEDQLFQIIPVAY